MGKQISILMKLASLKANPIAVHRTDDQFCSDAHLIRAQLGMDAKSSQDHRKDALLLHQCKTLPCKK